MSEDEAKSKDSPSFEAKIPPKLSRPLTCYGIFSVLERNLIWQQNQKPSTTASDAASDPYAAARPERYRGLVLPADWYAAGMNKKKRAEHKIHGKITFREMTKSIAEKWRTVDAETRAYCENIANDELARHKRKVAAFKERYGEEAFKAQSSSSKSNKKRKRDSLNVKEKVGETSGASQNNNSNEYISNIGAACNEVTLPQLSYQFNSGETAYSAASLPNYRAETNNNYHVNTSNTGTECDAAGKSRVPADGSLASSHINNSNFSDHLSNSIGTSYAAPSLPNYAAELNTTKTGNTAEMNGCINNLNFIPQTNATASTAINTNSFNSRLNNNISLAFAAASLPNYAADFSTNAAMQSAVSQCSTNNVGIAYPAPSFPDYTANFIRNLMQLQQGSFNGYASASSLLGTSQLEGSQAIGPQCQDQRLSDLSGDRSEDLELVGNYDNNALSGEESDKLFDNDKD